MHYKITKISLTSSYLITFSLKMLKPYF